VANSLNPTGPGLTTHNADHLVSKTRLLVFLQKWQATHLFNTVLNSLKLSYAALPLQCFQLASKFRSPRTCYSILQAATKAPNGYKRELDPWIIRDGALGSPFNSNMWSLNFWREHEIPPVYLYALKQAYRNSQIRNMPIAEEFKAAYREAAAWPERRPGWEEEETSVAPRTGSAVKGEEGGE
jgi:hypothetical protein